MNKKRKKKIIIDTDLGDDVDDAAALIMALNSPEIDIIGITTVYQNTYKRAEMIKDLCEQYGRMDIPVYVGYERPLIERPEYEESPIQYDILRKDRTYTIETKCHAVDFLIKAIEHDKDITIIEIGAMTNLAMAFHKEPQIMKHAHIIAMGGVFNSSAPEWNIICDPEAARIVTDYAKHLTMFGLDVTKYCKVPNEFFDSLCEKGNSRMKYYRKGVEIFQKKMAYPITLHDVLLIAYLIDETVVTLKQSDYTIELAGKITRGSICFNTNAYEIEPSCNRDFHYAKSIDVEKFMKLVTERIL